MTAALALLVCVGAGTIGGVFFAFSAFVMRALAGLSAGQGVAAMQRINVVVLNPLFLGLFMGTALLSLAGLAASLLSWGSPRAPWLLASGLLYLVGSFGVTLAFNVPRNERLARLDPESAEAAGYWRTYVREWTRWNHVRTVASMTSTACAAVALGA
ncbi:membrane protein [Sulfurifustis variabilis]|uniref:Membrane protein n=1 Tax=Sulfurifustis variabilis TaxID=1675686 RepID=A0A1B4V1I9_9GAMM|nr:anthrone oxygenase family protein [Sulfurifustis variabilis]BAU47339.1 membrane protein [Sulfurifustis variabilis]